MEIKAFFDAPTSTLTYVAWDPDTRDAVVIDPVLDLDPLAWRVHTQSADQVARFVEDNKLHIHWVLDTHAHADHLSGMHVLKERFDAPTVIGEPITQVQEFFKPVFNLPADFPVDGQQFDKLISDGEVLPAGSLNVEAIHTPGHTPACMSYKIGDAVFTGDALFMPDFGTGRCDFPKGSAEELYESIHDKLYALPDDTRLFVGHDYQPGGRELRYETTVGESKESNKHVRANTTKEEFVKFRTERDAQLNPPKLILQSLQVNVDAGRMPEPESNGLRYFRMPANFLAE
jgi:glyoxylase-like metal-dependent hydrolase (beta-lactamase superfamily II)